MTTRVTGTYLRPDLTPERGYIDFLLVPAARQETGEQITSSVTRAELDDTGSFSIDLVPDADLLLDGESLYAISEHIGGTVRKWWLSVPDDTAIDLPGRYPGATHAPRAYALPIPGPVGPIGPTGPTGPPGDVSALEPIIKDSATGRLSIAGIEMGDTGWRDVSSDLKNGWRISTWPFKIRRAGNVVQFTGRLNASEATSALAYTPPAGFSRPVDSVFAGVWRGVNAGVHGQYQLAIDLNIVNDGASSTPSYNPLAISASYLTDDLWPITLPGREPISQLPEPR